MSATPRIAHDATEEVIALRARLERTESRLVVALAELAEMRRSVEVAEDVVTAARAFVETSDNEVVGIESFATPTSEVRTWANHFRELLRRDDVDG